MTRAAISVAAKSFIPIAIFLCFSFDRRTKRLLEKIAVRNPSRATFSFASSSRNTLPFPRFAISIIRPTRNQNFDLVLKSWKSRSTSSGYGNFWGAVSEAYQYAADSSLGRSFPKPSFGGQGSRASMVNVASNTNRTAKNLVWYFTVTPPLCNVGYIYELFSGSFSSDGGRKKRIMLLFTGFGGVCTAHFFLLIALENNFFGGKGRRSSGLCCVNE